MAWLSRVNFISSDTLSFTDVNNLGNDIRAWGDNVNGGGYTLSNVVLSASSGTMATVTGGTGAASTLTIRSTSGTGTSDAIVFQTASQSERMRINTSGNIGIGTGSTIRSILNTNVGTITGPAVTAGLTLSANYSGVTAVNSIDWNYSGQTSSPVRLGATFNSDGAGMEMVFYTSTSFSSNGSERVRINKDGNVGIGTSSPATESTNARLALVGAVGSNASSLATTNTNAVATFRGDAGSGYLLNIGAVSADGSPYLQGSVYNGGSSASNLLLQPYGGNVGIGTTSPATSARLEIAGTTGALLVPRLTTTERNALTAVNGMIIYNATDNQMQGRINGAWVAM